MRGVTSDRSWVHGVVSHAVLRRGSEPRDFPVMRCQLQFAHHPDGLDGYERNAQLGAELGFCSKDALSASTVMVRSLTANRRQIGVPRRHTP